MKSIFYAILISLICFSATAADLKAEFSLGEISTLKEGDVVEGVLKVWPVENLDANEFKKLQNTLLFNSLQLVQINSIEASANNADVAEMKGSFIVRSSKYLSALPFNYKGQVIEVEAPHVKIIPLEKKSEDYFVLDQALSFSHYQIYILIAVLLIVGFIAFVKREKILAKLLELKKDPRAEAIKFFNSKFQNASTRVDYEEIYARKNEWLPLLKEQPSAYKEFFNVMNTHQYKPQWGSEEIQDVKSSFDIIRGSFK
jgi:hypothetical protein